MANGKSKLDEAVSLIEATCRGGEIRTAALLVKQHESTLVKNSGHSAAGSPVFSIASITKPMAATGVMVLVDRGIVSLSDVARKFLPEFTGDGRDLVTIRHLLTHTSGLPDMVPENLELRKRQASQDEFVAAICRTPLLFKPGTQLSYQSIGSMLLARIAEKVTFTPFRDFLQSEVFEPLGMSQTSLGLGERDVKDIVVCQDNGYEEWRWNGPYWRNFGAPWGGVHSTAEDILKLLDAFLKPDGRVLKPETASRMIVNQVEGLTEPWGLGWMIKPGTFGRQCSARTFGHFGSTGTLAWCDPETELRFVLLTTKPIVNSRDGIMGPVADLVAEWGVQNHHRGPKP